MNNLLNEQWRWIRGYQNLYKVSNYGRVRNMFSLYKGKKYYTTYGSKGNRGYLNVCLYKLNGEKHSYGVHDLVFEAFYRKLLPNEIVHHLSQVKTQNNKTNLVAWDRGRHTTEHKIGNQYNKGRKISEQHRLNLSKSHTGKKQSIETRMKRKESMQKYWQNKRLEGKKR